MRKAMELKVDSDIFDRIKAARMTESERRIALNALRDADVIVDAMVWIIKKIERLGERLFLKPRLKH